MTRDNTPLSEEDAETLQRLYESYVEKEKERKLQERQRSSDLPEIGRRKE